MTTPTLISQTEVWGFDPPISCARAYSSRGPILVHELHRTVYQAGRVTLQVRGVPTTSTGKPNGTNTWRSITDEDLQRLHLLVLDARRP